MKTFENNNIRKLTDQKGISFLLSDSSVNNITGDVNFGFNGEGETIEWKFEKGEIFDPDNNYVYSYTPTENFTLSGDISDSYYNYSINGTSIVRGKVKNDFKIENWFVNTDSGTKLNTSLFIYSDGISNTFVLPDSIILGDSTTGQMTNNSIDGKLYIFSAALTGTTNTNYSVDSFPNYIEAGGTEDFVFSNIAGGAGAHEFNMDLETNIGKISISNSIQASFAEVIFVMNRLEEDDEGASTALNFEEINSEGFAPYRYTSSIYGGTNVVQQIQSSLEYEEGNVGTYYRVTGVNIIDIGYGYTEGEVTVSFEGGEGNDVQAEGSIELDGSTISGVTITNPDKNVYYDTIPTVLFSGESVTDATGVVSVETYEKTFSECWDIYVGSSMETITNDGFETGNHGDVVYDYENLGPGIYTSINLTDLTSEQPLYIRIKGKSFYDLDPIKAKLKITGTLEDSDTNRLLEEITISSQNMVT